MAGYYCQKRCFVKTKTVKLPTGPFVNYQNEITIFSTIRAKSEYDDEYDLKK